MSQIPIEKEIPNVGKDGWYGKAKGVYQIFWERGYIKPDIEYTLKGKKDADGNLMRGKSLNLLIQKSSDFVNEPTMLQFMGEKMGVIIDRTPKCTPELAGEGIEYSWACAKGWYR